MQEQKQKPVATYREYKQAMLLHDRKRITSACINEFSTMITTAYENIIWKDSFTGETDKIDGNTLMIEFQKKPYVMVLTLLIKEADDGFYFNVIAALRKKDNPKLFSISLMTRVQRESLQVYAECVVGSFGIANTTRWFKNKNQMILTRQLSEQDMFIVDLAKKESKKKIKKEKKDEPIKPKRKYTKRTKSASGAGKTEGTETT